MNNAIISLAKSGSIIWAFNVMHAYMVAPRPVANLYGPDPIEATSIVRSVAEFLSK